MTDSLLIELEAAQADTSGVFVNTGVDAQRYLSGLVADIRANTCSPFLLSATVMEPEFPGMAVGSSISGYCVAHSSSGHWLVFQPERDQYYCLRGTDRENLGAHAVFGGALCYWSA